MESVYVVPVDDKWLLHAPLHGVTALLNKSAAAALREGPPSCTSGQLLDLLQMLNEDPARPGPNNGPLNPQFLGLITTRKCNLNCQYCNFGAAENCHAGTMDLDLAVSAVDWMLEQTLATQKSTMDIHFFGGEPFCAPQVMEATIHRARYQAARFGLKTHFEVSTNACFDEKYCAFAGNYLDSVVISLDGTPDIQNRQRPFAGGGGTYDLVYRNVRALSRTTELCLRVCISQESVARLEPITSFLVSQFRPDTISFESLQPSPVSETNGLTAPDPWAFAVSFLRASDLMEAAGITPVYAAATAAAPRHSFCPLGSDVLIVTPEGRVNGCYLLEDDWTRRGLNLNYGSMGIHGEVTIPARNIERIRSLTAAHPDRCKHCLARFSCAGGCRVNHSYPGCSEQYDDFCIQTRIITVGLLLRQIGCGSLAEQLVNNREKLESLVYYPSDPIDDWRGGCD